MKIKIFESLIIRPGMEGKEILLEDLIEDTIYEVKGYLNYSESEELPLSCKTIVQDLVVIKVNRIGSEGLSSESLGGTVSQNYINGIPNEIKARIRKFRRLPR